MTRARRSRAAVFATVAAAACSKDPSISDENVMPPRDLPLATGTGGISGTITDDAGHPVVDVMITTSSAGNRSFLARTNLEGAFRIMDIPPGTYTLHYHYDEHALDHDVVVTAGSFVHERLAHWKVRPADEHPSNAAKPYGAPPARRRTV